MGTTSAKSVEVQGQITPKVLIRKTRKMCHAHLLFMFIICTQYPFNGTNTEGGVRDTKYIVYIRGQNLKKKV